MILPPSGWCVGLENKAARPVAPARGPNKQTNYGRSDPTWALALYVAKARYVGRGIFLLRKCTEPSAKTKLTPPSWELLKRQASVPKLNGKPQGSPVGRRQLRSNAAVAPPSSVWHHAALMLSAQRRSPAQIVLLLPSVTSRKRM